MKKVLRSKMTLQNYLAFQFNFKNYNDNLIADEIIIINKVTIVTKYKKKLLCF